MAVIRPCRVCGHPLDSEFRWDEDACWAWIEDCLRWRGEILHGDHIHWCYDWDGLPMDETTGEHCGCVWSE